MMATKLSVEQLSVVADAWNLKLNPAKLKSDPFPAKLKGVPFPYPSEDEL